MSLNIILIVLFAAIMHTSWNFLVKQSDDKLLGMSAVVIGHIPFSFIALAFAPFPHQDALLYIFCSVVFHTGYQWFLLNAYRLGDLSRVYPLSRGVAPMLVTLVSISFLGVVLSQTELAAIAMIGLGIASLVFTKSQSGSFDLKTVLLSLIAGCFIAAYSMTDGLGARAAQSPFGYYAVGSLFTAIVWIIYLHFKRPGLFTTLITSHKRLTLLGGGASFGAYSLVVWAFTLAPIALVTSLRETSIIFAMLLGTFILKEKMSWQKGIAVALTLAGILALRMSQL